MHDKILLLRFIIIHESNLEQINVQLYGIFQVPVFRIQSVAFGSITFVCISVSNKNKERYDSL